MKQQNQCIFKTQSVMPNQKKTLSYNPTAIFTHATQTTMKPSVNQLIKRPKLTIPEFLGNALEWPEWSSLFFATVDNSGINDSLKMNHLKNLVTGKAKAAIAGMGYSGEMYRLAWETLSRNFGRTQIILNAQLMQIHAHQFIKPHDSQLILNYSQTISNCVNVLTQNHFVGDLTSESVLSSAVRKLPLELRSNWFFRKANSGIATVDLIYFSMWLTVSRLYMMK